MRKKKAKGKATHTVYIAAGIPNPIKVPGKHHETVDFIGVDNTYTLTWPDGSPFTGYMNPNDSFTTADSPVTIDKHSNNDHTDNDNDYMYFLSVGLGRRKKKIRRTKVAGGGDVIVDP